MADKKIDHVEQKAAFNSQSKKVYSLEEINILIKFFNILDEIDQMKRRPLPLNKNENK